MRILNLTLAILSIYASTVTTCSISEGATSENNQNPTSSAHALNSTKADVETEKYAVYSALIKELYIHDGVKQLVIQQQTTCVNHTKDKKASNESGSFDEYIMNKLMQEFPNGDHFSDDFFARQKDCYSLSQRLDVPVKYVLISTEEHEALFPKDHYDLTEVWKKFYEKYPSSSGIINFSNVGFNTDMSKALVYTGQGCGELCGAGYIVLLAKEQGVWKVKGKRPEWVS